MYIHIHIMHYYVMVCLYCIGDEIRALQKSLVDYSYQLTQLHQQLTSADRQRNTLKAKLHSEEIMQQQVQLNAGNLCTVRKSFTFISDTR